MLENLQNWKQQKLRKINMNEEKDAKSFLDTLEWHEIEPKSEFYDELERRYFINTTTTPLMIGFGHNTRQLEIIAIGDSSDFSKKNDPEIIVLEGEVIEEEE